MICVPTSHPVATTKTTRTFDYIIPQTLDKMKLAIFTALVSAVAAFAPTTQTARQSTSLAATDSRRDFLSFATAGVAAAGLFGVSSPAIAMRDYPGITQLGGGATVDLNNANVRVYAKMPGLYPTVAGKIASNGPYSSVGDVYNIPGLSGKEKEVLKKYEGRFSVSAPVPEYAIDRINNGMYK